MNNTTEVLIDLRERMVRIETKLDTHAESRAADREDIDSLQDRVSSLETSQKVMVAVGSLLLFLVTFFQDVLTKALGI